MIGKTTTYNGTEFPWMTGLKVRIVAVFKGGALPDAPVDSPNYYIRDNQTLKAAGGITAEDRVEVQPWSRSQGRFSFVTSDPRATDLACFQEQK